MMMMMMLTPSAAAAAAVAGQQRGTAAAHAHRARLAYTHEHTSFIDDDVMPDRLTAAAADALY